MHSRCDARTSILGTFALYQLGAALIVDVGHERVGRAGRPVRAAVGEHRVLAAAGGARVGEVSAARGDGHVLDDGSREQRDPSRHRRASLRRSGLPKHF